jgi:ankyrin repeat protein
MAKRGDALNKKLLNAVLSATRRREITALLNQGADVHTQNEWGLTPIMLAVQYNPAVVVTRALIEAGADIGEPEPKYRSNALHLAANNTTNPKIIEALIEAGANVEARNYLGETPLIMAVLSNPETRIATALIKAGSDINACDYQGHTVLEYARLAKRTYLINMLRRLGAT